MIYIDQLELINFQSHKHSLLDLSDMTAFVGRSSTGKSATERGLLWLFYGDWDDAYPADKAFATRVSVHTPAGYRIVRQRLGDKQKAWIIPPGQEEADVQPFRDFGYEIPGVFDIINMRPIITGKDKVYLNFAHQEPKRPFLVGDTKPAKAQLIGRLYGAHVVNAMLKLLNKDKLELGRRVKAKDDDLAALQRSIDGYAGLDTRQTAVNAARTAYNEAQALDALKTQVDALRAGVAAIQGRRWLTAYDFAATRAKLAELEDLEGIRTTVSLAEAIFKQIKPRRWLLSRSTAPLAEAVKELAELEAVRIRLTAVETQLVPTSSTFRQQFDASELKKAMAELAELEVLNLALSRNFENERNADDMALQIGEAYADAQKRLNAEVFSEGQCPLCFSTVDETVAGPGLVQRMKQLVKA